jgi:signal recognition particle subunit SRP54
MVKAPASIAKRAMTAARLQGFDVVFLDTAGRTSIDEAMMAEAVAVRDVVQPVETLLVADAMTGQDAVNTARNFNDRVGLTGIVLTRVDGDARGGAALSMRAVTGRPIKALGIGEKIDEIEDFHPERIAGRILGMGDVVSLVEKAVENIEQDEAERLAQRMQKGQFDLEDMLSQLRQLKKMGGLGGVMGMLPGIGKIQKQMNAANVDDSMIKRQEAIILSMTRAERRNVKLLNASRKRRVASGSGTSVPEINRLVKQYMEMAKAMKKIGKRGGLGSLFGGGSGGGMPPLGGGGPGGGIPGLGGGGLPGLGSGGLPPGFPGKR